MKVSTLKNKLNKLNIKFELFTTNNFNFDLCFILNNKKVEASFDKGIDKVDSYAVIGDYNECTQERSRVFYSSFNSLLKKVK